MLHTQITLQNQFENNNCIHFFLQNSYMNGLFDFNLELKIKTLNTFFCSWIISFFAKTLFISKICKFTIYNNHNCTLKNKPEIPKGIHNKDSLKDVVYRRRLIIFICNMEAIPRQESRSKWPMLLKFGPFLTGHFWLGSFWPDTLDDIAMFLIIIVYWGFFTVKQI